MYRVGLTGGIGAGKSTVAKMFEVLGVPVYYSDDRAKQIMVEKPSLIAGLKDAFGEETYAKDGSLNRAYLASKVFHDPEQLKVLNRIVHPALWEDAAEWAATQTQAAYTIQEAAIMFESGSFRWMDSTVLVYAPHEDRVQRTIQRDNISREEVLARMDKQMPEDEKMRLAEHIIYNDGSKSLVQQVTELHRLFLENSKKK
jgi:dephospho-CoA kinase